MTERLHTQDCCLAQVANPAAGHGRWRGGLMPCTCTGPIPGYPRHEPSCGLPDEDEDEVRLREWQDTDEAPPEED